MFNSDEENSSGELFSDEDFDPDFEGPDDRDIARFNDATTRCQECGALMYDDMEMCPKCGAAQESRYSFRRAQRRQGETGRRGLYGHPTVILVAAILVVLGFLMLIMLG